MAMPVSCPPACHSPAHVSDAMAAGRPSATSTTGSAQHLLLSGVECLRIFTTPQLPPCRETDHEACPLPFWFCQDHLSLVVFSSSNAARLTKLFLRLVNGIQVPGQEPGHAPKRVPRDGIANGRAPSPSCTPQKQQLQLLRAPAQAIILSAQYLELLVAQ